MSDNRIELTAGNWAKFRDPNTLKVKDRKRVLRNASNEEGLMQALSLVDGLIAILVEEWSFEAPIPSITIQSLDELNMPDYDILAEKAGEAQKILFPRLAETEEAKADVNSPFGNSKG